MLPRVLPDSIELTALRQRLSVNLDELLEAGPGMAGDTSEPLHYGFSTGLFLGYHGENNRALKTKLHSVKQTSRDPREIM